MLAQLKVVPGNQQKPGIGFTSDSRTGFFLKQGKVWVSLNGVTVFPLTYRKFEQLQGTQDGANTSFTCSSSIKAGSEIVSINGVPQKISEHYTVLNNTIIFDDAPLSGEVLLINYEEIDS